MHQIDASQKFVRRVHTIQMLARNAHELRQTRAGSDKHRIVAFFFEQFVNRDRTSDHDIGFELHAHRAHIVDLLANDLLGQPELRNAIHQHAADFVQRLENMHGVAFLHQIARRGQPRQAHCPRSRLSSPSAALSRWSEVEVLLLIVGDKALQVPDAERLAFSLEQASAFAVVFLRTDASRNRRQHIVFADLRRRAP